MIRASLRKGITLIEAGEPRQFLTDAPTVAEALNQAGITIGPADQISPDLEEPLVDGAVILLQHAQPVLISVEGQVQTILTAEKKVANLLAIAGVTLFPGDQVLVDGIPVSRTYSLPGGSGASLQVDRAVRVQVIVDGERRTFFSTAPTLGSALWEAGISLHEADRLVPDQDTPLTRPVEATLDRARVLSIQVAGREVPARSAARTVGEALAEVNVSLQGLDYSVPPEEALLPANGRIKVVQVRENVTYAQVPLPFETVFQPDPESEIDTQRIVEPGAFGLQAVRTRVRTEDGEVVSTEEGAAWVAVEPRPRVMGYGTQIVIRTLDTASGPIEYWRAATMYATSYSPCRIFQDRCSSTTASGATLRKGIAAVVPYWYWSMGGSQVFVPGYGVASILDTGGGIPGRNWIDLGYEDDNYVNWHSWVTVYFLTPVPPADRILYLLQ
jgi:uncharacterized protein YabE (DUF348 family)